MIQRLADKGDDAAGENHAAQCADSNAEQAVCTEPADGGGEDDGDEIQRVFAKPEVLVENVHLTDSLMTLSFLTNSKEKGE